MRERLNDAVAGLLGYFLYFHILDTCSWCETRTGGQRARAGTEMLMPSGGDGYLLGMSSGPEQGWTADEVMLQEGLSHRKQEVS